MKRDEKQSVDNILREYKEELQNLFKGKKTKSFDEITGEAIEKMKNELKKAAEQITEEENKKTKGKCSICGREVRVNQYDAEKEIVGIHFKLNIKRDLYFCRHCGCGFAPIDEAFDLFEDHNITKDMAEEMAYSGQNCLSFEKGAENIKRY
ncbi:MAG: hypothetical protein HPY74_20150, partial [Firmicutes bacterium]|nr:hypothetical protein [Bacillota bacterium]